MPTDELPIPAHFAPGKVGQVWKVDYQQRAEDARRWAAEHQLKPSSEDRFKIALLLVDVQNTFCIPEFELYVGGRSGSGAVDDNRRLCDFIYRNLNAITRICPTMDTHQAVQIFHSVFLVNEKGEHPAPFTLVTAADVSDGVWKFNPAVADSLNIDPAYGQRFLQHYTRQLREGGKYDLTIWPYHAMLGGIGHALVSAVEEAMFFHSLARCSQPAFHIKGNHPFTENYSVLRPEVLEDPQGEPLAASNTALLAMLLEFHAVFI
ncbi:MAG: isochorismatase, partial [Deltaproteobacteria bacterium SG8_13]